MIDLLFGELNRHLFGCNHELLRHIHEFVRELHDAVREGCRKEHGLPFGVRRHASHQKPQVGDKPHVEHAVCFVNHQELGFSQTVNFLFKVINEAAWRADEHVYTSREFISLFNIVDAAEYGNDMEPRGTAENPSLGIYLGHELPCRCNNERPWRRPARCVRRG